MLTLFLILLVVAAVLAIPTWPYSRGWGYYPSGSLGLIALLILLILFFRA